MRDIVPQLSELDFSQCHNSYVVNFRHVKELQKICIYFTVEPAKSRLCRLAGDMYKNKKGFFKMVVIVCVEIFDAYRRTYKVPYDRAWTDFKKEQKNIK